MINWIIENINSIIITMFGGFFFLIAPKLYKKGAYKISEYLLKFSKAKEKEVYYSISKNRIIDSTYFVIFIILFSMNIITVATLIIVQSLEINNSFINLIALFWFLTVILMTLAYLSDIDTSFISIKIRSSRQAIIVISPKISDQELKEIWSKFHQIRSKSDYDTFKDDITTIAEKHNLILPDEL